MESSPGKNNDSVMWTRFLLTYRPRIDLNLFLSTKTKNLKELRVKSFDKKKLFMSIHLVLCLYRKQGNFGKSIYFDVQHFKRMKPSYYVV